MNTSVHVWHFSGHAPMVGYVEQIFARNEALLSRFRPESELSRLNKSNAKINRVSADLFAALEHALWFAAETRGIYDPTLLTVLESLGYDRSFEQLSEQSLGEEPPTNGQHLCNPVLNAAWRPSFEQVKLDRLELMVSRPMGLRFDLGGMGKGWTVDRAADLMHPGGPFFINAGGDIYAGGSADEAAGWPVDIEDPTDSRRSVARVHIRDRALATSTISRRFWFRQGRKVHHLIDPRQGSAADTDVLSATVIAARTVVAEVVAKTALILGTQMGVEFLEAWPGVEGLLHTCNRQNIVTSGFGAYLDAQGA